MSQATRQIKSCLEMNGGIAAAADLARHWRITRSAVTQLSQREDFPQPVWVTAGGKRMWSVKDVDDWRTNTTRRREVAYEGEGSPDVS